MSSSHLFFFYLLLNSMLTTLLPHKIADDHLALLAFRNGVTFDPSGALSSWNESVHFCNWTGVSCSHKHPNRVTALDLSMLGLGGFLSPSIANLSFMQSIELSINGFSGEVPPEFGRLHRLQYLNLSFNALHGMVPVNLANCSKLRVLSLSANQLSGSIPVELGQTLPKLEVLLLLNNSLTGVIPSSIGNLSSLTALSLGLNNLQGIIPEELGRLSNLLIFQVATNWLNGSIPPVLFNISSLNGFIVAGNKLHGTLPPSLGAKLPKLKALFLGGNKLSGTIPASLSNASMLQKIDLRTNKFSGTVPPVFGGMNALFQISLDGNQFQANDAKDLSFIDSLVNCSNLQLFSIASNDLGGVLPLSLANFSKELWFLAMPFNHFSGTIPPGIGNLISLTLMDFSGNDLTGQIPENIGNLQKLQRLGFGDNKLTGYIPSSIGNLTQLTDIYMFGNKFEGTIPSTMKNLHQLTILSLPNNSFSGRIPGEIFSQLLSLRVLDLGINSFSGTIPLEIGGLINLQMLLLYGNKLSGEIPHVSISGCVVLEYLDLQGNHFTGSIPSSLGNLKGLRVLNLSDNSLSEGIPSSFSNLQFLEALSLSNNNLLGSIPQFLEDFKFLSVLNLSYNHFHGELPVKGVFGNSSVVLSVVGNGELCGGVPRLHLPVCLSIAPHKTNRGSLVLKIVLPIASFMFGLFLILYFVFTRWKRESRIQRQTSSSSFSYEMFPRVSYDDLARATDGFSSINQIGKGRHGSVYKGTFTSRSSTMSVAIKVFNLSIRGASKSFWSECESLRSIKHRNLIKIITLCLSCDSKGNDFKALVLDFMSNGSLDSWLHPEQVPQQERGPLSLLQRLNVATDVADAMEYLHHSCQHPVVHCDLKPSNVLLDDDMNAHVGDFGLAKFFMNSGNNNNNNNSMESSTMSSIGIKGTVGYVPPEYGLGSEVSTMGDVYSYGILVLELFTGKRPVDGRFKDGMTLRKFVEICASHDRIMEVIDPSMFSQEQENDDIEHGDILSVRKKIECLVSVVRLGLACSVESPNERLGMTDVAAQMHAVRDKFLEFGVHGVKN
ncbi:hypothetical protein J5N97_000131 [Dioscorea zingiberensis]|uniref:Receptor kinase-like protein Xa21 n=1 Tax=Dioscorea zingiberensis TaxID=325984 RepID=A0A9D5BSR3_9LILI|nr:hypothetical protein J5N97_000131 [Dioscorea zingiberensis]